MKPIGKVTPEKANKEETRIRPAPRKDEPVTPNPQQEKTQ